MTPFAFATIETDGGERATLVLEGGHYRLDRLGLDLPPTGLRPLMDDWDGLLAAVAPVADRLAREPAAIAAEHAPRLVAPLRFPNKLVCVGAVYSDHLAAFGLPPERWANMPMFLRAPTVSIVGPGDTVRVPPTTREFDWEIELAVVIGRRLTRGSEDAARAAIAGYSIGIDLTCRDLLDRTGPAGPDLVRAKAQDGMAPLGPYVVPAAFVGDPQMLSLKLWVNDRLRQDGTSANMLFPVYEQIATISRYITLEPGDVVFTGSPAGSAEGDFLTPGDRIRAEIEKVGVLELGVIDQPA